MASLTRWTWVWVISWSWWRTGRRGMLLFMRSQRVGQDQGVYWTILLGYNCLHCFLLSSFLFHLSFICLPNAELAIYNSPLTIQPNWCPDIFKCPLGKKSLQCSMTSIANCKYYSLFKWKTQSLTELGRISAWEDLEIHLKVKADSKLSRRIND